MAKFYQTPNGDTGLRHGQSIDYPIPEAAEIVEFDENTNPDLMHALCGRNSDVLWQEIEITDGEIVIQKRPVTINSTQPVEPTIGERVAAILEWAEKFRAALQTADSVQSLRIEDAKHPPLPEKDAANEVDSHVFP